MPAADFGHIGSKVNPYIGKTPLTGFESLGKLEFCQDLLTDPYFPDPIGIGARSLTRITISF
jgi:hypothetical protein